MRTEISVRLGMGFYREVKGPVPAADSKGQHYIAAFAPLARSGHASQTQSSRPVRWRLLEMQTTLHAI